MDDFFPQQMPPPLPGWDGAPMGFNGGLGMGGLPMGMGMNGAGAFGGMMGEQQHPGPYIPFPSTSFAPFGGEGEMAGTGPNMGMDGQFGGFDVNGFRLPNSLPSRPSDSPTSPSFPNGNGNGHFEGPTFNNAEAGPSNSHFADYVFHPDANQNHDHNNSGQDDSGNTYVDFHGFVRNKPFDKANIQPIKNFDNITIHFAAANPQHPNKIGVTYEPSQSTRGLFPVQSTFVPSTTPVPPRRPSSSSTPTSPALSPPDPSTTLVMEMIPRKFRTKALIYKWLENVDGCPMPKRVEVEGGKALIEFWGRDREWARRVFGSQRMAGNDGLGSVRVWWWRGEGKGVKKGIWGGQGANGRKAVDNGVGVGAATGAEAVGEASGSGSGGAVYGPKREEEDGEYPAAMKQKVARQIESKKRAVAKELRALEQEDKEARQQAPMGMHRFQQASSQPGPSNHQPPQQQTPKKKKRKEKGKEREKEKEVVENGKGQGKEMEKTTIVPKKEPVDETLPARPRYPLRSYKMTKDSTPGSASGSVSGSMKIKKEPAAPSLRPFPAPQLGSVSLPASSMPSSAVHSGLSSQISPMGIVSTGVLSKPPESQASITTDRPARLLVPPVASQLQPQSSLSQPSSQSRSHAQPDSHSRREAVVLPPEPTTPISDMSLSSASMSASMANVTSATTPISGSFSLEYSHKKPGDKTAKDNTGALNMNSEREGAPELPSKSIEGERRVQRERSRPALDINHVGGRAPQPQRQALPLEREEGELVEGEEDEQTSMDIDVDVASGAHAHAETEGMDIELSPELAREPVSLSEETATTPSLAVEDIRESSAIDAQEQLEAAAEADAEPPIPPLREEGEVQDRRCGVTVDGNAEEGEVAEPVGLSASSSFPLPTRRLSPPVADADPQGAATASLGSELQNPAVNSPVVPIVQSATVATALRPASATGPAKVDRSKELAEKLARAKAELSRNVNGGPSTPVVTGLPPKPAVSSIPVQVSPDGAVPRTLRRASTYHDYKNESENDSPYFTGKTKHLHTKAAMLAMADPDAPLLKGNFDHVHAQLPTLPGAVVHPNGFSIPKEPLPLLPPPPQPPQPTSAPAPLPLTPSLASKSSIFPPSLVASPEPMTLPPMSKDMAKEEALRKMVLLSKRKRMAEAVSKPATPDVSADPEAIFDQATTVQPSITPVQALPTMRAAASSSRSSSPSGTSSHPHDLLGDNQRIGSPCT